MDERPNITTVTVSEGLYNMRADKFLSEHFDAISRTQIQKIFQEKAVYIHGSPIPKKHLVSEGDTLQLVLPELGPSELVPFKMDLDVLFEDDDIIVLNKASGTVMHPGNGTGDNTLVHGLLHYLDGNLSRAAGERRPGIVHRLDKDTSGCVVFAKTDKAYYKLIDAFSERTVKKEYLALTKGVHRLLGGSLKEPIGRHPTIRVKMRVDRKGREAHTDWKIESAFGGTYALVRCYLHTGRTHQIRVHMSHLGMPLVGDITYGYKEKDTDPIHSNRVHLHAEKLAFDHPISGEPLAFTAPLPEHLTSAVALLKEHFSR